MLAKERSRFDHNAKWGMGAVDATGTSSSSQAVARPERREGLGEYESESHHFSCSTGLAALSAWKEARGVVTLTSSDLHAEALTIGVAPVAASGTRSTGSAGASVVPLVKAGSAFAEDTASPFVVSAIGADSVAAEVGSVGVSSDFTALLGLRNRPPSFCGSGDFLVSPSVTSDSDFSFLLPRLLKREVRRFSFKVGLLSEVAVAGDSETALVSGTVAVVTGSSALASFFCYIILVVVDIRKGSMTYLKLGVLSLEETHHTTFVRWSSRALGRRSGGCLSMHTVCR